MLFNLITVYNFDKNISKQYKSECFPTFNDKSSTELIQFETQTKVDV